METSRINVCNKCIKQKGIKLKRNLNIKCSFGSENTSLYVSNISETRTLF